jgi:hypothetical protein
MVRVHPHARRTIRCKATHGVGLAGHRGARQGYDNASRHGTVCLGMAWRPYARQRIAGVSPRERLAAGFDSRSRTRVWAVPGYARLRMARQRRGDARQRIARHVKGSITPWRITARLGHARRVMARHRESWHGEGSTLESRRLLGVVGQRPARQRTVWLGRAGHARSWCSTVDVPGSARRRQGSASLGRARHVTSGVFRADGLRSGSSPGCTRLASQGSASHGSVWQGLARVPQCGWSHGGPIPPRTRLGTPWLRRAALGQAPQYVASPGTAGVSQCGRQAPRFEPVAHTHGAVRLCWSQPGNARPGAVRQCSASRCMAMRGKAGPVAA